MMAELQLERPRTQCQRDDLMAETYAEYRHRSCKISDSLYGAHRPLGVPGSVWDEDTIRLDCLYLRDAWMRRKNVQIEPATLQTL